MRHQPERSAEHIRHLLQPMHLSVHRRVAVLHIHLSPATQLTNTCTTGVGGEGRGSGFSHVMTMWRTDMTGPDNSCEDYDDALRCRCSKAVMTKRWWLNWTGQIMIVMSQKLQNDGWPLEIISLLFILLHFRYSRACESVCVCVCGCWIVLLMHTCVEYVVC